MRRPGKQSAIRRRGPATLLVLGAALALTACASPTGAVHRTDSPTSLDAAAVRTTPRSQRAHTDALVQRLLDDVRVPKGAHARASAPVRALEHSGSTTGATSNVVDRHRWWTSAASVHTVLAYVRHHAPSGCRFDGSGTSTGPDQATVHDVMCNASSTSFAYGPRVDVSVVHTSTGSAIEADAEAVWIPVRPAYSKVHSARSVHVVVRRRGYPDGHDGSRDAHPTIHRTLGTSAARQLAGVLNRQSVYPPIVQSCPADWPGNDDQLVFSTPSGHVTVTVGVTGCPSISVAVPHHHTTGLLGAGNLDAAVRKILHLSSRYSY